MSITTFGLSQYFIRRLGDIVNEHSSFAENPLDITVSIPELIRLRIYFYYCDQRNIGGHLTFSYLDKDSERETLYDYNDVNFIIQVGFIHDEDIFVLWDASKLKELSINKRHKVDSSVISAAHLSRCGVTTVRGKEIVISSRAKHLAIAVQKRIELSIIELARRPYEFA